MRLRKILPLIYILSAAIIALVSIRCNNAPRPFKSEQPAHYWLNISDTLKYVGINTCKKCHYDVYSSFIQTGMGQSFGHATMQKSKGDFKKHAPLYDKFSDLYYQPYWQDSVMMIKEFRLQGRDTIHKRTEKVEYIIGSGHHTNSHIMNTNGYLYQMPFTFYVQKGQWDMPPGFENGFNTRFGRSLGLECLSCHNAYPDFVKGSVNKYNSVPQGIDCERCHGPGSIHAREKLAGKIVDVKKDTDFTIVNPRKLPFKLQIDVCQRCHLQGDAVLKPGKSFFDFHPGMKLSEVMDVFLPTYENDENGFLMAAHAQRLKKSHCFLESNKAKSRTLPLNCISCHNPHISVKVTKAEFFNAKCQSCHQGTHFCKAPEKVRVAKGNNCVSCHMPKSAAVDIPHVTITDHYIRVVKNHPKDYLPGVGRFKGLACLTNDNPDKLVIAKAYMYFFEKFEHKAYNLDSAFKYLCLFPESSQPEAYIYYFYLKEDYASILRLAGNYPKVLKEAVSNYQAGQSAINLNRYPEAIPYLQKAVSIEPYNLDYHNKLGTSYLYTHDFAKAQKEFNFILKENPKLGMGWNGLAFLSLVKEDIPTAKTYINKALAFDPDYEPALLNRVKLSLFNNDKIEALKELKAIIKKYPKSSEANAMLALLKGEK
jgi:hypothetical protein